MIARAIGTVCGVGLLRPAPGTWGSAVALPLGWAIHVLGGFPLLLAATLLAFVAGWWATAQITAGSDDHDPSEVVVDEVAGQWIALFPLSYAGGQQPAFNLTLMPGLVKNHDHAARLNESEFMGKLEEKMADDDVMVLVHGYLAGGFVGKDKCITSPEDVAGQQTRAAGKAFEQMLAGAGASIASMASSEIYNAMQTGVLTAANTSSSSFVSYRIYEQVSCYTPAGDVALWFMYQPLLMNKSKFDGLNADQQKALMDAAAKAQAFYLEEAKKQDAASEQVFRDAGVEIAQMSAEDFEAWRALAQETSYAKFVAEVDDGQALLDMALAVE